MEVDLAQRMAQLGYKPELLEEGDRDIRFVYRQPEPQPPQGQPAPPGGGGMPPGMPPGGMPPGMPPGGMPPGMPPGGMPPPMMGQGRMPPGRMPPGRMPPGMPPMMPPQAGGRMPPGMAQSPMMPPSQPGGEGMGMRNRGPVRPQNTNSMGSGSPISSVQQRGPPPTRGEANSNALLAARRPRGA